MTDVSPKFVLRLHQGGFDYPYLRELFRAADGLGYDGASLYDLLGIPTLECWTTLSALAAETAAHSADPDGAGEPVPASGDAGEDGGYAGRDQRGEAGAGDRRGRR